MRDILSWSPNEILASSICSCNSGKILVGDYRTLSTDRCLFPQIYDYFLTLSQEIDLIWPSQPSIVKMLFFLTRYTSWINVVVLLYCQYITPRSCVWTEDALDQLKIEISLRSCEQLHTVSACTHCVIASFVTDNRAIGLTLIGFLVAEGAFNPFEFVLFGLMLSQSSWPFERGLCGTEASVSLSYLVSCAYLLARLQ